MNKPKYQQIESPLLYHNESHVKLEELNSEHADQPLKPSPVSQVESNQQLESPEFDLIGPFILEGL